MTTEPTTAETIAALIAEARVCPFEDACSDEALVKRLCTALETSEAARATVTAERDALELSRDNWKKRRVEAVKGQQAVSAHDGTIIADLQQRLSAARDSLKQVEPIKAQVLAEHGQITSYEEVLVDLIEETLAGLGDG